MHTSLAAETHLATGLYLNALLTLKLENSCICLEARDDNINIRKDKLVPDITHQAMKAEEEVEIQPHTILTSAVD
jgi:hypothetical protein